MWHKGQVNRRARGAPRRMRARVRIYVLLASIWFVVSLPLPWLIGNDAVPEGAFYTILGIIGIMSIPFVMLAIVWSARPELAS